MNYISIIDKIKYIDKFKTLNPKIFLDNKNELRTANQIVIFEFDHGQDDNKLIMEQTLNKSKYELNNTCLRLSN